MTGAHYIRDLFASYGQEVDESLRQFFAMQDVSYELYGHLAYFMGFADESLQPTELYGGKRFRSSICLLLADWMGNKKAAVSVATALELFHNFTLIHDDIVDGDTHRRGRKTVWHLWGTDHAINSGDAQLLLAYQVLANNAALPPERLIAVQQFLTQQFLRVVEGQYLDFTLTGYILGDARVTEAAYFEMVGRKTADLIAAATKAAGLTAGATVEETEVLFQYGYNLGIAYQLCDDIVSIWGTSQETGKREYGDVLERKKTIPILYAAEKLPTAQKKLLFTHYNAVSAMTVADAQQVVALLDSVQAAVYTRTLVDVYAGKAKTAVAQLPFTVEQKDTLSAIVDALLPDIKSV